MGSEIAAFFFTVFLVLALLGGLFGTIYFAGEAHNARRVLEKRRTSPEHYTEETVRMHAIARHLHAQTELDEAKLRRALKQAELNEVESVLRKGSTGGQSSKR